MTGRGTRWLAETTGLLYAPNLPMSDQPNVLIIMADQLRRAALGCYGDPNAETPNIDRLAREGTRFRNSCATYPICVPYRFTFMTGQTAQSRGVSAIGDRMSPAERTLADEFNEAGYHTAYVGKWHLDGNKGGYVPWGGGMTGPHKPIQKSWRGSRSTPRTAEPVSPAAAHWRLARPAWYGEDNPCAWSL